MYSLCVRSEFCPQCLCLHHPYFHEHQLLHAGQVPSLWLPPPSFHLSLLLNHHGFGNGLSSFFLWWRHVAHVHVAAPSRASERPARVRLRCRRRLAVRCLRACSGPGQRRRRFAHRLRPRRSRLLAAAGHHGVRTLESGAYGRAAQPRPGRSAPALCAPRKVSQPSIYCVARTCGIGPQRPQPQASLTVHNTCDEKYRQRSKHHTTRCMYVMCDTAPSTSSTVCNRNQNACTKCVYQPLPAPRSRLGRFSAGES